MKNYLQIIADSKADNTELNLVIAEAIKDEDVLGDFIEAYHMRNTQDYDFLESIPQGIMQMLSMAENENPYYEDALLKILYITSFENVDQNYLIILLNQYKSAQLCVALSFLENDNDYMMLEKLYLRYKNSASTFTKGLAALTDQLNNAELLTQLEELMKKLPQK